MIDPPKRDTFLVFVVLLACVNLVYQSLRKPNSVVTTVGLSSEKDSTSDGSNTTLRIGEKNLLPAPKLKATLERPLFHRTRRPLGERPSEAIQSVDLVAPQVVPFRASIEETYVLRGVLLTTQKGIAILEKVSGGTSIRAVEGDHIDGWTLKIVMPDSAIFENAGQTLALQLAKAGSAFGGNIAIGATPPPPTRLP